MSLKLGSIREEDNEKQRDSPEGCLFFRNISIGAKLFGKSGEQVNRVGAASGQNEVANNDTAQKNAFLRVKSRVAYLS